jgi:succinoglycan biosynthesis transport protein ExoP
MPPLVEMSAVIERLVWRRRMIVSFALPLVLAAGMDCVFSAPTCIAHGAVLAVNDKTSSNVAGTGGTALSEQQVAQLRSALITARAASSKEKAYLDWIVAIPRDDHLDPAAASFATDADALDNPLIIKLRQQYVEYAAEEAVWSGIYGANHPTAARLRGQMRTSRESILAELHRIAETHSSDYDIAKARENALSKLIPEARRPLP